jgi:hypothetical protein
VAARQEVVQVIEKLRGLRLIKAIERVEEAPQHYPSYDFISRHGD